MPKSARGGRAFRFLEEHRLLRALAIGAAAAVLTLATWTAGLLGRAELASYDLRVRATAPGGRSDIVEVVDYDDETIEFYDRKNRWGRLYVWPRDVHAAILGFIARGKPRAVVFDFIFAEGGQSAEDGDFADACGAAGNVVLACELQEMPADARQPGRYRRLSAEECADRSLGPGRPPFASTHRPLWPFEGLRRSCRACGVIGLEPDQDGVMRSVSPAVNHPDLDGKEWLWPTLSTAAASVALESKPVFDGRGFTIDGRRFDLEASGRRLVYWYGRNSRLSEGEVPRYRVTPAHLILRSLEGGKNLFEPLERFRDKVVVLGTSGAGLDERSNPLGHEPGMYIHANAIENLMRGDGVSRRGGVWTVLTVFLLALLIGLAFPGRGWRAVLRGSAVYVVLAGGQAALAFSLYARAHLWVDLAAPQLGAGLAYAGSLLAGYLVEGRRARRLRRGLSRFLSPQVLAEVGGHLDELRPGMGRRCEVSMMFCDVRNFTTMSEKLEPEQVLKILEVYLGRMTEVIMASGGTLSKYLGDGIMAFWGAPQSQPDHAARAARVALEMIAAQEEIKRDLEAAGQPSFEIGIGLHRGPAVVGVVGSDERLEYTAIGDTVNLASRVESLTKEYKVRIVVTSDLAEGAGGGFDYRQLGHTRVKGRSAEVRVMELLGRKGEEGL